MQKKTYLIIGIVIIIFLAISYFIKINVDGRANYIVESTLLGVIIFYNPFILALYIFIAIVLILRGLS